MSNRTPPYRLSRRRALLPAASWARTRRGVCLALALLLPLAARADDDLSLLGTGPGEDPPAVEPAAARVEPELLRDLAAAGGLAVRVYRNPAYLGPSWRLHLHFVGDPDGTGDRPGYYPGLVAAAWKDHPEVVFAFPEAVETKGRLARYARIRGLGPLADQVLARLALPGPVVQRLASVHSSAGYLLARLAADQDPASGALAADLLVLFDPPVTPIWDAFRTRRARDLPVPRTVYLDGRRPDFHPVDPALLGGAGIGRPDFGPYRDPEAREKQVPSPARRHYEVMDLYFSAFY